MKELSVKEVTEVLKVSETTVRRMIKRGDLPNAHRQNRKLWIPQSDIDAYLQRQQEASGQETKAKTKPKPKPKPKAKPKPKPKAKSKIEPEPSPIAESEVTAEAEVAVEAEVKMELKPSEPEAAFTPAEVPELEPKPQEPEPSAPVPEVEPTPVEAAPVEESEPTPPPSPEAPPKTEPETPVIEPEWADPLQHQKEIIKEQLVNVGIKVLGWLEQSFKKIRAQIEQHKDQLSKKDDSEKKTDE